jgi:hypothetical protein
LLERGGTEKDCTGCPWQTVGITKKSPKGKKECRSEVGALESPKRVDKKSPSLQDALESR